MDNTVLEHISINTSDWVALAVFMLLVIRYKLNIRIYSGLSGLRDLKQELVKQWQVRQQEAVD